MRPTLAVLALSLLVPAAAPAATLGRMTMEIGSRTVEYRITDAADAGSGWEARPEGKMLSILWQGPQATDLLLMEMVVKDGRPVSARIALPEAQDGTLEARMPATLSVDLARVSVDGPWLRIRGRLSGTFFPQRANGRLLPDDGKPVSARFETWVPGISPPLPKAKAASAPKHRAKATPAAAATPPHLRPQTVKPQARP